MNVVQQSKTPETGHADEKSETRQALVDAAVRVFLKKGYGGTRVQDIAREAGFTSGALYVHFPSRSALLAEALIDEGREVLGEMLGSIGRIVPEVQAIQQSMIDFSQGEPTNLDRLLVEALVLSSRPGEGSGELDEVVDGVREGIRHLVVEAQSAGVLAELDADALTQMFLTWTLGMTMCKMLGQNKQPAEAMMAVYDYVLRFE